MSCDFKSCLFYLFLSFLAAIGTYIIIYIAIYIYIAYITYKFNSNDLIQWREQQLQQLDEKYNQLTFTEPTKTIVPPP